MSKIIGYSVSLFMVYFMVCLVKNTWDSEFCANKGWSDMWCSENIAFTEIQIGDFTPGFPHGRYEIKATADNSDYGIFFIDADYPTVPDSIELNKVYKVEFSILGAHSWKDFFLLGTCYDAEVIAFHGSPK